MRLIWNRKSMFLAFAFITVIYVCWTFIEMSMISAVVGRNSRPKRARNANNVTLNKAHSDDTVEYLKREMGSSDVINHNHIPVHRQIPDTRSERCKTKSYSLVEGLKASVIIAFFNESRSALLRTLTSILNRSPIDLLEEIILIDDHSTADIEPQFLGSYHEKIKLIRNTKREGLIRSRNIGAKLATGHYLIFMDSHCEVNIGWLEPLIHIADGYKGAVVSPILDVIDWNTLQYRSGSTKLRGGFDWRLQYKWIAISEEELGGSSYRTNLAYSSPSIPGGVFLIRREWFFQLGGFDNNLKIYGGESLDLSLKTWMCGGQIEIAVCSRIGHVFRRKHSFDFPNGIRDTIMHNTKCIAESWLDDYKFFYYSSQPKTQPHETDADCLSSIAKANRLKQKLQCRSFRWYMQNVFQELRTQNDQHLAFGELKHGKNCLEVNAFNTVIVDECLNDATKWFFNQSGTLSTQTGDCLASDEGELKLTRCQSNNADQMWLRKRGNLIHLRSGQCLENIINSSVVLSPCHQGAQSQIWNFSVEIEELT